MANNPLEWPSKWGERCVLVAIDAQAVPLLSRALTRLEQPGEWATHNDWINAFKGIAEIRKGLMADCLAALMKRQDDVYRLLDSALNGTVYSSSPGPIEGEVIISPAIPTVPTSAPLAPGMRAQLELMAAVLNNLANGTTYGAINYNPAAPALTTDKSIRDVVTGLQGLINTNWFGGGGEPVQLKHILEALQAGGEQQELDFRNLASTAKGAATVETLGDALTDFMANGIDAGVDGAIGLSGIVGQIGQITINTLILKELQRIRAVLHPSPVGLPGDPIPVPPLPDTIIEALRGSTPASSTRNVIDAVLEPSETDEEFLATLLEIRDLLS